MRPLLLALLLVTYQVANAQASCDSLKDLLGTMLDRYEWIRLENEQIASEMDVQHAQIDSLRSTLDRVRYDLEKAHRETQVLRGIMKGYIITIDSLNTVNKELQRGDR